MCIPSQEVQTLYRNTPFRFPSDPCNLWLCSICMCAWVCAKVCVFVRVIGWVQTHVPRSSSLQATKSMNQKPPEFSQIHNNADHKYWKEDTPKTLGMSRVCERNLLTFWIIFYSCIIPMLLLYFFLLAVSITGHGLFSIFRRSCLSPFSLVHHVDQRHKP